MRTFFGILLWINLVFSGLGTLLGGMSTVGGSLGMADISFLVGNATVFSLSIIGLLLIDIATSNEKPIHINAPTSKAEIPTTQPPMPELAPLAQEVRGGGPWKP